jgi:NAD(P)-dependent dehydrogenase (short-subunit alcohol dehydrogenase family)
VTGASGGLGSAVVPAFEKEGAVVLPVARSAGAEGIAADLMKDDGARGAVGQAIERAGRIDALAHIMGGWAGGKPVAETDDATWRSMMGMNLDSAFYVARAVLPHMIAAERGRIVFVGSRTAVEPGAGAGAYNAAKAGLVALARSIAAEVKDSGITCNAVLPSIIDTPANRAAMPTANHAKWVKPQAIADLIVWLSSDAAADVNGAAIPIYGRTL